MKPPGGRRPDERPVNRPSVQLLPCRPQRGCRTASASLSVRQSRRSALSVQWGCRTAHVPFVRAAESLVNSVRAAGLRNSTCLVARATSRRTALSVRGLPNSPYPVCPCGRVAGQLGSHSGLPNSHCIACPRNRVAERLCPCRGAAEQPISRCPCGRVADQLVRAAGLPNSHRLAVRATSRRTALSVPWGCRTAHVPLAVQQSAEQPCPRVGLPNSPCLACPCNRVAERPCPCRGAAEQPCPVCPCGRVADQLCPCSGAAEQPCPVCPCSRAPNSSVRAVGLPNSSCPDCPCNEQLRTRRSMQRSSGSAQGPTGGPFSRPPQYRLEGSARPTGP